MCYVDRIPPGTTYRLLSLCDVSGGHSAPPVLREGGVDLVKRSSDVSVRF